MLYPTTSVTVSPTVSSPPPYPKFDYNLYSIATNHRRHCHHHHYQPHLAPCDSTWLPASVSAAAPLQIIGGCPYHKIPGYVPCLNRQPKLRYVPCCLPVVSP